MDRADYLRHDAIGLAGLIRSGAVSAAEVLAAARAQIAYANPRLNAVIAEFDPPPPEATADAPFADAPFAGVPFLLKDIGAALAGQPSTCASRFFAAFPAPKADSELTRRFRRAGLRIIGKSNLPELGFIVTTEPSLFGPSRNPWNPAYSTGGSSGGSAAAIAAGMVPLAHATDGAGSIRIPAACCGLIGLKPSRGALPQGPEGADIYGGLVGENVISRTVRDSALALDIAYGADPGAPYAAPAANDSFLSRLQDRPKKLRIGLSTRCADDVTLMPGSREAVAKTARLLAQLGHHVDEVALPLDDDDMLLPREIYLMQVCAQAAADIALLRQAGASLPDTASMEAINLAAARRGAAISAADYLVMERRRHRLTRKMAGLWESCDLLLTPALAGPALLLGSFPTDHEDVVEHVARMVRFSPFTTLFNVTGEPAIALPSLEQDGLPVGVQLATRLGGDGVLLQVAAQLEAANAWGSPLDRIAPDFRP